MGSVKMHRDLSTQSIEKLNFLLPLTDAARSALPYLSL
jgi:hypothetical protein